MAKIPWLTKLWEGFDKYSDEETKENMIALCNDNCLKNLPILFKGIEDNLDDKTKRKILYDCGRNCTPVSLITKAKSIYKKADNLDDFLVKFAAVYNHLKLENNSVYVEYPRCYCGKAKKFTNDLPTSFCYCSIGWIKELFEKTLNKSVNVMLEKSIINGDSFCRFKLNIE